MLGHYVPWTRATIDEISNRRLTVAGDGEAFKEFESLRALKGRNLSMRELAKKLGRLVVDVVLVRWKLELEAGKGSGGLDL